MIDTVNLLFTCVENACRSQMSAGFARHFGGEDVNVYSGGSKPADRINENAVKVMKERGIDISSQEATEISSEAAEKADLVITMGCGPDACPVPVAGKTIEWDLEDPAGKSIEKFREVRDEIEDRVKDLLERVSESV